MNYPSSLEIKPASGPVNLDLTLPGSKSITNRAMLLSALAHGRTTLENALFSEDTVYMGKALKTLGYDVTLDEKTCRIEVTGGKSPQGKAELFVGNAGTAMRFLTGFLNTGHGEFIMDGDERMRQRPIQDLLTALAQLGCDARSVNGNGCPPVRIIAQGIPGGECTIRAENSSQYLSSILMAAPAAQNPVTLKASGDVASRPYLEMTLAMMKQFGAEYTAADDLSSVTVKTGKYQSPGRYMVEPDASSATYFLAMAAILGGRAVIRGLGSNSLQGDAAFAHVLKIMGCRVEYTADSIILESDGRLHGVDVDMNAMPDTVPTLAVVAMFADGPTKIRNVPNLRIKESDRISALATEIGKLGGHVKEFADGLEIFPERVYNHAPVFTYNDHRIAMSFAVAGLKIPGVVIENPGCVAKSFPDFFVRMENVINK